MPSERDHKSKRKRIWIGVGILLLLFAAAAAWKWTPLADLIDVNRMARWAASLRESPARHFYLVGAYIIGSILLVPITLLILVTAVVFGAALGAVYSLIGCLAGALVTYAIGYFLGQDFIRKIAGSKWQRIERKIGQTGIIAVATLRLLPVAPFSVVNIVSGAFKVPLRDYILGSILGLVPGILITNLFAHQFQNAIRNPGAGTFVLLTALIVITVAGTVWLKRRFETAT
jgi:phospholipase D1/2